MNGEKHFEQREYQVRQCMRLQQNLAALRKLAGLTTENLGEKMGVNKQTITNLENGKTPLGFIQYMAIRTVLDYEIEQNKENTILKAAVTILLDGDDALDEEKYATMKDAIEAISISSAGGIAGATLATLFTGMAMTLGIALAPLIIPAAVLAPWAAKFLDGDKRQSDVNAADKI